MSAGGDISKRNMHGATPLHSAAYGGSLDAVKWLLGKGLKCDCRDYSGYIAEDMAQAEGHDEVVEALRAIRCTESGKQHSEPAHVADTDDN